MELTTVGTVVGLHRPETMVPGIRANNTNRELINKKLVSTAQRKPR